MNYSFLDSYKIPSGLLEAEKAKSIGRLRHCFFSLPEIQIQEAFATFDPFPEELKKFYLEIGFGFMYRKKGEINTILDPLSLVYTNLQINYFATPAITKELSYYDTEKQLLFFKTASNQYLAIDREAKRGLNTVYYKGKWVADSLYDFLKNFDFNRYHLKGQIDNIIFEMSKQDQKAQIKSDNKTKNVKRVGGHRLLDPY